MTSGFEGQEATWFFQVTLPVMATMITATLISIMSIRRHDLNRRAGELTNRTESRLGRIEDRLLAIEREVKAWR